MSDLSSADTGSLIARYEALDDSHTTIFTILTETESECNALEVDIYQAKSQIDGYLRQWRQYRDDQFMRLIDEQTDIIHRLTSQLIQLKYNTTTIYEYRLKRIEEESVDIRDELSSRGISVD